MHHQWDDDAKNLFAEAAQSPGNDGAQFVRSVEVVSAYCLHCSIEQGQWAAGAPRALPQSALPRQDNVHEP